MNNDEGEDGLSRKRKRRMGRPDVEETAHQINENEEDARENEINTQYQYNKYKTIKCLMKISEDCF